MPTISRYFVSAIAVSLSAPAHAALITNTVVAVDSDPISDPNPIPNPANSLVAESAFQSTLASHGVAGFSGLTGNVVNASAVFDVPIDGLAFSLGITSNSTGTAGIVRTVHSGGEGNVPAANNNEDYLGAVNHGTRDLIINIGEPVDSFGTFLIDMHEATTTDTRFELSHPGGGMTVLSLPIPNNQNSGSVGYYGFTSSIPFTTVRIYNENGFSNGLNHSETFALDQITIGNAIPAPGIPTLLFAASARLVMRMRRDGPP